MMTEDELIELSSQPESPVLEFKRQWYWDDSTSAAEMQTKWGEFLKDLIAISNSYIGHCGLKRHMIIGLDESDKTFHHVDISNIKQLKNLATFKSSIMEKTERLLKLNVLDFKINIVDVDSKQILVFEVNAPKHLIELKSSLQTKTRAFDEGAVLIRKGQSNDEVRMATFEEMSLLKTEFKDATNNNAPAYSTLVVKKDRSIGNTIELFISKNSNYSLDIDSLKTHKDWEQNIIFEHYQLNDIFNNTIRFIYIHEDASQAKTYRYLRQHGIITNDNINNIMILTERPTNISPSKRKENLIGTFKTDRILFIDEFGYQYLYKNCLEEFNKFSLPIYIESLVDNGEGEVESAHSVLKTWYKRGGDPLFVVKGHGGIGKTTLAKQFLDYVHTENPESGILFIDSNDIINELSRLSDSSGKIDDVFDFYLAQYGYYESSQDKFSKDLLKLSLDNGSLIIVLDGLDEVIARLGEKFKVSSFIESIYDSKLSSIERSKILITCREHFWDSSSENERKIPEITLKPFSKELAIDFFSQALNQDNGKVDKAMALAGKIAIQQNNDDSQIDYYVPYVLDLIVYLVKQDADVSLKGKLDSTILNLDFQNDFIVGSVCNREIKKLEALDIDAQIRLLTYIALSEDSSISIYDIKAILKSEIGISADDSLVEKIKGHPLLTLSSNGKKVIFRYDFFNIYFKSLYLSIFLKNKNISSFDEGVKELVSGYVRYNNDFTRGICERLCIDEDVKLFLIECVGSISTNEMTNDNKSLISSLFTIPLTYLVVSNATNANVEVRSSLMKDFFQKQNSILGFRVINLFGYEKNKPNFDFRNLTFIDCSFDNYEYFWDCYIDEGTRFYSSEFKNINPREGVKPIFFDETFSSDCDISDIKSTLEFRKIEVDNKNKDIRDELISFFKIFHERGNFYPKKQQHVKSKLYASKLLPTLLKNRVVESYTDKHRSSMQQYKITEYYRPIVGFLEQGGTSSYLDEVVSLFIK
ncbi:NACHT domain-containing protein [Dickeya zeae]|uniref:NACHT domain-containing protein n=1 Tax=Dickeya zeae TaxID=204042 RepID=UPI001F420875|nr:NACHT domain-containing protein [Dickeya zeae]UJR61750.1 ATP-binding protein [Dickeya zeae]